MSRKRISATTLPVSTSLRRATADRSERDRRSYPARFFSHQTSAGVAEDREIAIGFMSMTDFGATPCLQEPIKDPAT